MKIIKQFESNDFAKRISPYLEDAYWIWGLGDDGFLYVKGKITGRYFELNWMRYEHIDLPISLTEMKKIVSVFGNLLPFI